MIARSVAAVLLLAVVSAAGAAAQELAPAGSPPPALGAGDSQPIPDYVLYRFFFAHLENLDRIASQLEAAGKDGQGWRSHEQRAAGLGAEEGAILKQVAAGCNLALEKQRATIKAAIAKAGPSLQEPSAELRQLGEEEERIVAQRVARLRSRLGEAAFQQLDRYLQQSFRAKIKMQAASTARVPGGGR
jgi:hypothetical protein